MNFTNNNGRITIRDVAIKAGVSVATVSRVINNDSRVNPKMKKAVLKAKEELGYFQNAIARSLKTNSTLTIGYVASDISNTYLMLIAKEIESLINIHNYHLIVCSTEDDKEQELKYLELLNSRNIDGLVLNGTGMNESYVLEMNKRIPMVLLHRRIKSPEFVGDLIDTENEQGVYQLTKYLTNLGHKRIFVIKGPDAHSNAAERLNGFSKAMKEIGINIDDNYPYMFKGDFFTESGYDAIEYMLSLPILPTAIIALNSMMAVGALKYLKSKSINIPEDLSFVCTNYIEQLELMTVRPTIINYDPILLGKQAGKALLERLSNNEIENREFVFGANIIHGNAVSSPKED